MRSKGGRRLAAAAMAIGVLMLAAAPVMAASSISVNGYSLNGSVVMVTVHNNSSSATIGTVAVQAKIGGLTVISSTPVALSGNQTTTVGVAFVGSVCKVLSVGISDENVPI